MTKILIVEDDAEVAGAIETVLAPYYDCELVDDGSEALHRLKLFEYDLLMLDINLPKVSGLEILSQYRINGGKSPVMMLTARDTLSDKVEGLECGADDYLIKPFAGRELLARARALLRRPAMFTGQTLKVRDLVLERESHRVFRNGEEIRLLFREFALLEFLMRNVERVYSAEQLLRSVWQDDTEATVGAVTTCLKRLRQKIDVKGEESYIRSIYGVGYKIES